MKKHYSIRFLLLAALAAAFSLILVFTVLYSADSQRDHLEEFSHKYVDGLAKSYFDGLNTMMVTGTIGNRDVLRQKVMASEDVLDVRVIRSDHLNRTFGAGNASEQIREPLDEKALAGERVEAYSNNEEGRVYTLIEPVIAMENYQGVNCLGCHQAKEGDVLGAIRVDYSLADSDARLQQQLLTSGGIQVAIFAAVFFMTAAALGRLVFSRLRRLHDRMDEISSNSDLTIELEVTRNDEIGSVSLAFNRMMANRLSRRPEALLVRRTPLSGKCSPNATTPIRWPAPRQRWLHRRFRSGKTPSTRLANPQIPRNPRARGKALPATRWRASRH